MTGDSFADHLPAAFVEDDFAGRFVTLLDSIHASVTDQIDMAAAIFDPTTAPPRVVRLIGRWAGIDVPDDLGDDRARHHVCSLVPLVRRRGTRRWLEVLLSSLAGQVVVVEESRVRPSRTPSRRPVEPGRQPAGPRRSSSTATWTTERP